MTVFLRFDGLIATIIVMIKLLLPLATLSAFAFAIQLPNGKLLDEVPGDPRKTNNYPTAAALSPDESYAVFLNCGYGAYSSGQKQSLTVLNLKTNELRDFPDDRLPNLAKQTYFLGLGFSTDGKSLYASMASLTDPLGKDTGSTGNGIAVYSFESGEVTPTRFLKIPPRKTVPASKLSREDYKDVTYPAGLSVAQRAGVDHILIALNGSDEAVLMKAQSGQVVQRFDLSTYKRIPGSLPYTTIMTGDAKRGYVSLWNASSVAELDLVSGKVAAMMQLGSHPTALLLSPDERFLYVALTNEDRIDVVDTKSRKVVTSLSTRLPTQQYGGSDPESLTLSKDGKFLFSANAISDSVAVFDLSEVGKSRRLKAIGFIPTQWYPTSVLASPQDLLIGTAKGTGSGPNKVALKEKTEDGRPKYPYNPAMTNGSLARIPLNQLSTKLDAWTTQALAMNASRGNGMSLPEKAKHIKHVVYIIKENRTYDQLFGDIAEANGYPSITMYGEDITPNHHKLARQFGILDNFYDSGDVSGNGHIWSTAGSASDHIEKTWPIAYRGSQYSYDSEGSLLGGIALEDEIPDASEPTGGYIWCNLAEHGLSYRHYGEFIVSTWCKDLHKDQLPTLGPPETGVSCDHDVIKPGEPLPSNVGNPHGAPSPFPWDIPVLAHNVAAEKELQNHFDPLYPDFDLAYPDQLRADEFLNDFERNGLPQFVVIRLPNDHTAGGKKGMPRPAAMLADNDLALGRIVEAVSNSKYWDDTAIFVVEDDAQDGPDHVDSHRSIALVISKYAPIKKVDSTFYTTVNLIRTMEALLGLPPINANDERAAIMTPLFDGPGTQQPYKADYRNLNNKLIFQVNGVEWAKGKSLDFSRADAADDKVLNEFLWHDAKGDAPMPVPSKIPLN